MKPIDPGTAPKVGDAVFVDGSGEGTIAAVFPEHISVRCTYHQVTVPIAWYRQPMGWTWSQSRHGSGVFLRADVT